MFLAWDQLCVRSEITCLATMPNTGIICYHQAYILMISLNWKLIRVSTLTVLFALIYAWSDSLLVCGLCNIVQLSTCLNWWLQEIYFSGAIHSVGAVLSLTFVCSSPCMFASTWLCFWNEVLLQDILTTLDCNEISFDSSPFTFFAVISYETLVSFWDPHTHSASLPSSAWGCSSCIHIWTSNVVWAALSDGIARYFSKIDSLDTLLFSTLTSCVILYSFFTLSCSYNGIVFICCPTWHYYILPSFIVLILVCSNCTLSSFLFSHLILHQDCLARRFLLLSASW